VKWEEYTGSRRDLNLPAVLAHSEARGHALHPAGLPAAASASFSRALTACLAEAVVIIDNSPHFASSAKQAVEVVVPSAEGR